MTDVQLTVVMEQLPVAAAMTSRRTMEGVVHTAPAAAAPTSRRRRPGSGRRVLARELVWGTTVVPVGLGAPMCRRTIANSMWEHEAVPHRAEPRP